MVGGLGPGTLPPSPKSGPSTEHSDHTCILSKFTHIGALRYDAVRRHAPPHVDAFTLWMRCSCVALYCGAALRGADCTGPHHDARQHIRCEWTFTLNIFSTTFNRIYCQNVKHVRNYSIESSQNWRGSRVRIKHTHIARNLQNQTCKIKHGFQSPFAAKATALKQQKLKKNHPQILSTYSRVSHQSVAGYKRNS